MKTNLLKYFVLIGSFIFFFNTPIFGIKVQDSTSSLNDLKIYNPELYQELFKLPEAAKATYNTILILNKIAHYALSDSYAGLFKNMLAEGIVSKRRYCTPLQALYWLLLDIPSASDNFLDYFTIQSLVRYSWEKSSISNNYLSDKWTDFSIVAERLNSPLLISIYMSDTFTYTFSQEDEFKTKIASNIFNNKTGACYDWTLLAGFLLSYNGYDNTWGTIVYFKNPIGSFIGHVACIYQNPIDFHYYVLNYDNYLSYKILFNLLNVGAIHIENYLRQIDYFKAKYKVYGPFQNVEEAANQICYEALGQYGQLKAYKTYAIDVITGRYINWLQ